MDAETGAKLDVYTRKFLAEPNNPPTLHPPTHCWRNTEKKKERKQKVFERVCAGDVPLSEPMPRQLSSAGGKASGSRTQSPLTPTPTAVCDRVFLCVQVTCPCRSRCRGSCHQRAARHRAVARTAPSPCPGGSSPSEDRWQRTYVGSTPSATLRPHH